MSRELKKILKGRIGAMKKLTIATLALGVLCVFLFLTCNDGGGGGG